MILSVAAAAVAAISAAAPVALEWREGAVFVVAARPGRVTDIALQPGETLSATGAVAAGDTVRWIVGESESGSGAGRQTHVLVKPTTADIATNLVVSTDRRVYHLELKASDRGYTPAVSWRYPEGELIALKGPPAGPKPPDPAPAKAEPPAFDLARLNFCYRIEGQAPWRPERVYDDGRRTVIDFPASISSGEMPPLFVMSAKGDATELVNYRVEGRRMIVDRLFQVAELRMGAERRQLRVRLVRLDAVGQP
jgi:type IV secretion system protein VirB9